MLFPLGTQAHGSEQWLQVFLSFWKELIMFPLNWCQLSQASLQVLTVSIQNTHKGPEEIRHCQRWRYNNNKSVFIMFEHLLCFLYVLYL